MTMLFDELFFLASTYSPWLTHVHKLFEPTTLCWVVHRMLITKENYTPVVDISQREEKEIVGGARGGATGTHEERSQAPNDPTGPTWTTPLSNLPTYGTSAVFSVKEESGNETAPWTVIC